MPQLLQRLTHIDRRIIFLLVGAAVVFPLLYPLHLPTRVNVHTQDLFDELDRVPPDDKPVILSVDYGPATMPELQPMAEAVLRHCFARRIRVIVMTLGAEGVGLAETALANTAPQFDAREGEDYVFLGFKAGVGIVILTIGESLEAAFPTDAVGRRLADIAMLRGVRNYEDIPLVISVAGSTVPQTWMVYAGTRYHARVGVGTTAVSAADYYPFLKTRQFVGMLNGMKGAAEYEWLLAHHGLSQGPWKASQSMDAVSVVHILIILFIVLGNLGYFASRRATKKGGA